MSIDWLRAVLRVVEEAQSVERPVLVVKTEPGLSKHLVRRGARFHGVALFDLVERVHGKVRVGPMSVVLVGSPSATASRSRIQRIKGCRYISPPSPSA